MTSPVFQTARDHLPEYLMEAGLLALFMISASSFTMLLFYPRSPLHDLVVTSLLRRLLMGVAMGLTALALIMSPWGKRSGAHLNPAVTLTFWRLGKVRTVDAVGYILGQFIGGYGGIMLMVLFWREAVTDKSVNYIATRPGTYGVVAAWIAEFLISFILMTTILNVSNRRALTRFTPWCAALLITLYITFEAPFSGMSMNPARSFGPAFSGWMWESLWVYFTAPPLAMLLAAELYRIRAGLSRVYCAKLQHLNDKRCIFNCRFRELMEGTPDCMNEKETRNNARQSF